MKKIGEGMQYRVYDREDGTVLKRPKNRFNLYNSLKIYWTSSKSFREVFGRDRRRENSIEAIKNRDIPVERLFRIKEIRDNGVVVQKKLRPVEESLEDGKDFEKVVDDYIDLIHEMWRYGFGDGVYNFTVNNGYDGEDIVMMDFGELFSDKDEVKKRVSNEKWLKQWSYSTLLDDRKKLFEDKMRENVNVEKLELLWNSKS